MGIPISKTTYFHLLSFKQTQVKQEQLLVVPSENVITQPPGMHFDTSILNPDYISASILTGVFLPFGNSVLPHEDIVAHFADALYSMSFMDESQMLAQMNLLPSQGEGQSFVEFFTMTFEQLLQVPVILSNDFSDLSYDELQNIAVIDEGQSSTDHLSFGSESGVSDAPANLQTPSDSIALNAGGVFSSALTNGLSSNDTSSGGESPTTPVVTVTMQQNELNTQPYSSISANVLDLDPPSIVWDNKVLLKGGLLVDMYVKSAYQQWIGEVYKSDGLVKYMIKGAANGSDVGSNYLIFFTKDVNISDLASSPFASTLMVNNPFVPQSLPPASDPLTIIGSGDDLLNIDSSFLSLIFQNQEGGPPSQFNEVPFGSEPGNQVGSEEENSNYGPNVIELNVANIDLSVNSGFYRAGSIAFVLGSAMPSDFPYVMIEGQKYFEIKFEYVASNYAGSSSAEIIVHIEESEPVVSPHFNQFSTIDFLPTVIMGDLLTSAFSRNPTYFGPNGGSFTNATVEGGATYIGSQNIIVTDPFGNQLVVNELTGQYAYFVKTAVDAFNVPLNQVFHIEMTDLHGNVGIVDLTLRGNDGFAPVVLDLTGQGINLNSAYESQVSVTDSDGYSSIIGWAASGNGVLAYDPLGTGHVTSLNQIDFTSYTPGAKTDLQGLIAFDSNHNDKLDFGDEQFSKFGVVLSNGQFQSLSQLAIEAISLVSDNQKSSQNGNLINGLTTYETSDGQTHVAADVIFGIGAQGKGTVLNLRDIVESHTAANDSALNSLNSASNNAPSVAQPAAMSDIDHVNEQIAHASQTVVHG